MLFRSSDAESRSAYGLKRPRLPTSLDKLKKTEGLWMEDGTVVLVTGKHMFRVYRGMLAMQSIVFHDMFSPLRIGEVHEVLDGIPVFRLEDNWMDARWFLKTIFRTSLVMSRFC